MHRQRSSSISVGRGDLPLPGDPATLKGKQKAHRKMGSNSTIGPTWSQLARRHWPDYVMLVVMFFFLSVLEVLPPFKRKIFHGFPGHESDVELWRYSYPLLTDTVPPWMVPPIAFMVPSLAIALFHFIKFPPRADTHAALLGLFSAVLVNAIITNGVKIMVGRPRPDFMARCWPGGAKIVWNSDGTPACSANSVRPDDGRKSFPSGHTSWSTTGLGYLSFWVAGKLQCFDCKGGQPWRIVIAVLPISGAVYIGLTRIEDYWHHWEDVLAGFILGSLVAYTFYRQQFPPLNAETAGEAHAVQTAQSNGATNSVAGGVYSAVELRQGPPDDSPV